MIVLVLEEALTAKIRYLYFFVSSCSYLSFYTYVEICRIFSAICLYFLISLPSSRMTHCWILIALANPSALLVLSAVLVLNNHK